MKLGDGVEQAIHSVTMLAILPEDGVLPAAALAEFHRVSTSYLLKHLQALSRAGIALTVPAPKGGYRLAKSPVKITVLDIVLAVEGPEPAFRCKEIRQNGPKPLPPREIHRALPDQRCHAARRTGLPERTAQDHHCRPERPGGRN